MSAKQGLLALLAEEPMYGARLRSEFEARTGGTWPLNVGQVYRPSRASSATVWSSPPRRSPRPPTTRAASSTA
ncbi:PadR family transcriptional regulator [Monashia sp. NPDC004114]